MQGAMRVVGIRHTKVLFHTGGSPVVVCTEFTLLVTPLHVFEWCESVSVRDFGLVVFVSSADEDKYMHSDVVGPD